MRKIKKFLAATMALTMIVSATGITACDFGGSRELTSIVVANGSYDASYTLGETVSFADIVITAKYNDASTEGIDFSKVKVFLNGEDITANLNKITESIGKKEVIIKYEGKEAKLTITVSSDVGGGDVTEPVIVAGFEAPGAYANHLAKKAAAGQTQYTREKGEQKNAYETEFATGTDMFMAGDDNEFKFLPTLRFLNANDQPETATKFDSTTTVSLHNGTEYGALESRVKEGEEGIVEYFAEDTVYLTANTANNTYDFADAAIGKQFKLAVLPAGNFQYTGTKSVDCEVKVVDGYNVYTAK
ncbi:MAG: bacterial Ig-like domain-containing protein, partial [Clostridia bacterium]|nr:bacterial Ig-like domain-containing protein [Clostridia bacterium]